MENAQNTGAVQDAMVVEEAAEVQQEEVSLDQLAESLAQQPEAEDPEAVEESEPEQEAEPELTPEEAQRKALSDGIQSLFDDGWTGEELKAFSADNKVREDIAAGKTVRQAALAYMRRQSAPAQKPAKRGVPTALRTSTADTKKPRAIAEMTDAEFARFSEEATRLARQGKRVTIR